MLLALLTLGSCNRDDAGIVELVLEPMGNNRQKLTVEDDSMAVWDVGDKVKFNGVEEAILRQSNGRAYISDVASQSVNSACFPASLCQGDITGATATVSLPSAYHYRTSATKQVLELPMLARADEGDPLQFRHLTAALSVVLENSQVGEVSLTVDSIIVASDKYQLSGSRTVDMNAIASTGAVATNAVADRRVVMVFDRERLVLGNAEQRKVLIPVPPVGTDNHFTITVIARCEGSRYTYSRVQSAGGALVRNQLAYAGMKMSGASSTNLFGGNGTYYYIRTSIDLVALSEAANAGWRMSNGTLYSACNYRLVDNIDMEDVAFSMIGTYTGTQIDGDNHSINHLTVDGSDGYCGLIKKSQGLTIRNLTLNDVTLRHAAQNVAADSVFLGAFCAMAAGVTTLNSCQLNGLTVEHSFSGTAGQVYFGGMLGGVPTGGASLTSCTATINDVSCSFDASNLYYGNMIGWCESSGSNLTFSGCVVNNSGLTLNSTHNMHVGGFIGFSSGNKLSLINGCSWSSSMSVETTGTASSVAMNVGRLIGYYAKGTNGTRNVTGVTATGSINVKKNGQTDTVTYDIGNLKM